MPGRNDNGGTLYHAICDNPNATPEWLGLAHYRPVASATSAERGRRTDDDINRRQFPLNLKWKAICRATRTVYRNSRTRSDLVMDMAHVEVWPSFCHVLPCYTSLTSLCLEGATPLHFAARQGNLTLVHWLLENGATRSLLAKNRMGCTPIELGRKFGPHHEVCGMLGSAMCSSVSLTNSTISPSGESSALRIARSGQTAIPMQHDMSGLPFMSCHAFDTVTSYVKGVQGKEREEKRREETGRAS